MILPLGPGGGTCRLFEFVIAGSAKMASRGQCRRRTTLYRKSKPSVWLCRLCLLRQVLFDFADSITKSLSSPSRRQAVACSPALKKNGPNGLNFQQVPEEGLADYFGRYFSISRTQ
jgi:hypothetical protein